jgi:hypothetical protein
MPKKGMIPPAEKLPLPKKAAKKAVAVKKKKSKGGY